MIRTERGCRWSALGVAVVFAGACEASHEVGDLEDTGSASQEGSGSQTGAGTTTSGGSGGSESSDEDSGSSATSASTGSASTESSSTGSSSDGESTDEGATTGAVDGFELFRLVEGSGLCRQGEDCDSLIELDDTGLLQVEEFGGPDGPVIEVQISEDDLAAAILVFADPALIELLDAPGPLCEPPSDLVETMILQLDGVSHEADTTFCEQPPLVAARDMAAALRAEYVP